MVDDTYDQNMSTYPIYATNVYVKYLNSAPTGLAYWESLANEKAKLIWVISKRIFLNLTLIIICQYLGCDRLVERVL